MKHFETIGEFDISAVLPKLQELRVDQPHPRDFVLPGLSHKSIFLRVHDGVTLDNWLEDLPVVNRPLLADWTELQKLIMTAWDTIRAQGPTGGLGRVVFSVIEPSGFIQWHVDLGDYAKRHRRWHVPLLTNRDCVSYARDEAVCMPPGGLTRLDTQVPHCSVNWGATARTHLLFETRAV